MTNDDILKEMSTSLKRFCNDQIEPFNEEDDEKEHFRMEIFHKLGELGLTGLTLPENFGGANMKLYDLCFILEELAKSNTSYAVTMAVSTMVQSIINQYGNQKQKEKFLPPLCQGLEIGSFCLSESHSGSDAAALKTQAVQTDDGWVLNGSKMWITSASLSSTFVILARTSEHKTKGISAFLVEANRAGLVIGKKEKKIGWRTSPTCEVLLQNLKVTKDDLLGELGDGFKVAMSALDRGRITIGAISVGLAQRALDEAIKYAKEREQFGSALAQFQGIQWMIADMDTDIVASRLLVEKAAKNFDSGIIDTKLAAQAKMRASDVAMKVSTDAVQIHGGVGVTKEYPVERLMRDAKILQIVEGTNQVQKIVISRQLLKD